MHCGKTLPQPTFANQMHLMFLSNRCTRTRRLNHTSRGSPQGAACRTRRASSGCVPHGSSCTASRRPAVRASQRSPVAGGRSSGTWRCSGRSSGRARSASCLGPRGRLLRRRVRRDVPVRTDAARLCVGAGHNWPLCTVMCRVTHTIVAIASQCFDYVCGSAAARHRRASVVKRAAARITGNLPAMPARRPGQLFLSAAQEHNRSSSSSSSSRPAAGRGSARRCTATSFGRSPWLRWRRSCD